MINNKIKILNLLNSQIISKKISNLKYKNHLLKFGSSQFNRYFFSNTSGQNIKNKNKNQQKLINNNTYGDSYIEFNYDHFQKVKQNSQIMNSTNSFMLNPNSNNQSHLSQSQANQLIKNYNSFAKLNKTNKNLKQFMQEILKSDQKNLFKIVEELLIVLESFSQKDKKDFQQYIVKIIKKFNNKLISAYLINVQLDGQQLRKKYQENLLNQGYQNEVYNLDNSFNLLNQQNQSKDGEYSIFNQVQQKNSATKLVSTQIKVKSKQHILQVQEQMTLSSLNIPVGNKYLNQKFIFYYLQTIKNWIFTKIQTDQIVRQCQVMIQQSFLMARQVSQIQQILQKTINQLVKYYIMQENQEKREQFPFDKKIRALCLLPYMNKEHIEIYFKRLHQENIVIHLRQSQIISLMYYIAELKPNLLGLQDFIYQIQSTKIYQTLSNINYAYIKSCFINYVRNFMVCFQQIQFYELFRELQPKIKNPTIRTFIRLIHILTTQAQDLHCQYNKFLNKFNYNILINVMISQFYTIQNTKLQQMIQLFEKLNKLEKSGEILYEQMIKYLKAYQNSYNERIQFFNNENNQYNGYNKDQNIKQFLTLTQKQGLYRIFKSIVAQTEIVYKYEQKQGLNKQFSKKTLNLTNILFDNLLDYYPQMIIQGRKFIKNYISQQDYNNIIMIDNLFKKQQNQIKNKKQDKIVKIKNSIKKIIQVKKNIKKSLFEGLENNQDVNSQTILDTLLVLMKNTINMNYQDQQNNIKQIKDQNNQYNSRNNNKLLKIQKQKNKKVGEIPIMYIIFSQSQKNKQTLLQYLSKQIIYPFINEYKLINFQNILIDQSKNIHRILYKMIQLINLINLQENKTLNKNNKIINEFITQYKIKLIQQIKNKLQIYNKKQEQNRNKFKNYLDLSLPKDNKQILLSISQIIKYQLNNKIKQNKNISNNKQIFQNSELNLIFKFINNIGITSFKSLDQCNILIIFQLIRNLQFLKPSTLLISFKPQLFQVLYQTLSVFIIYSSDRGRYYLKLVKQNDSQFLAIINQFVQHKQMFKNLVSKKKLVMLQIILTYLIRKKYLNFTNKHLKRSQHSYIVLSFIQIFQFRQNITVGFKKIFQEIDFTPNQLEQFQVSLLESFSQINNSICYYLEDNKINLTSPKKLFKMTQQQLRNQFKSSEKIYQMIVRNKIFNLTFKIPQPGTKMSKYSKLMYITQKIYQKIVKQNNYAIKSFKKNNIQEYDNQFEQNNEQNNYKSYKTNNDNLSDPLSQSLLKSNNMVNIQQQIQYIKGQSLVNYTYQQHYKLNETKLPIHFKKQTWKSPFNILKQNQIQSLQIDQKIDQNFYKMIILALLGYVQKVKLICNQFHHHSIIQYITNQLDMQITNYGCVSKVCRKNKQQQNILFVSSSDHNYKLLYICVYILRMSGENAYIVTDKNKDFQLKNFIEKALPQAYDNQVDDLTKVEQTNL